MKTITAKRSRVDRDWYVTVQNEGNNRIIADGGEGYVSKSNVVRAMRKNWEDGYTLQLIRDTPTLIKFQMVPRVA